MASKYGRLRPGPVLGKIDWPRSTAVRVAGEQELSEDEANAEYERTEKGLRYQLIEGKLRAEHNLQVTFDELKDYAQNMIKEVIKTFKDFSIEKDPANNCLDVAIITDQKFRTKKTIKKLNNIAGRVLNKK